MGDGLASLPLGAAEAEGARADIAADKLHTRATGTLPLNRELAGWEATEETGRCTAHGHASAAGASSTSWTPKSTGCRHGTPRPSSG